MNDEGMYNEFVRCIQRASTLASFRHRLKTSFLGIKINDVDMRKVSWKQIAEEHWQYREEYGWIPPKERNERRRLETERLSPENPEVTE